MKKMEIGDKIIYVDNDVDKIVAVNYKTNEFMASPLFETSRPMKYFIWDEKKNYWYDSRETEEYKTKELLKQKEEGWIFEKEVPVAETVVKKQSLWQRIIRAAINK